VAVGSEGRAVGAVVVSLTGEVLCLRMAAIEAVAAMVDEEYTLMGQACG